MARPVRIEYEGAFYHVTSRGNERKKIFYSRQDYDKFKAYLRAAQDKHGYLLHCYVLMSNHYHLLIETPKANLSKLMHYINGSYTNYINRRKRRSGHLFQGRYKAILVDRDSYLLELSRYVHLNPVRAKIVEDPEAYSFSSYRSYVSKKGEDIVYRDMILEMICEDGSEALRRYRVFAERGIREDPKNPLKEVYGGSILGAKGFIKDALARLKDGIMDAEEISYRRQLSASYSAEKVIDVVAEHFQVTRHDVMKSKGLYRSVAIHLTKKYTGMTNRQIGEYFGGLSYSAVAKVQERLLAKAGKDRKLMKTIKAISNKMSNVKG